MNFSTVMAKLIGPDWYGDPEPVLGVVSPRVEAIVPGVHSLHQTGEWVEVHGEGWLVATGMVVHVDALGITVTDEPDWSVRGYQVFYPWASVISICDTKVRVADIGPWPSRMWK